MRATWLPEVLGAAGLQVVTHPGWQARGQYGGEFAALRAVVWHHDASATGDSPGVVQYLLDRWDTASAQAWVSRHGVWHVLAAGPAYHAGRVLAGMPGNRDSLGVETDHTEGEDWPAAQLDSLRAGTAAILGRLGVPAETGLHFHRTICSPVGRKSDPAGLDLTEERATVARLMSPPEEVVDVDETALRAAVREEVTAVVQAELAKAVAYLHGEHALILHGDKTHKVSLDSIAQTVGVPGTRP